MADRYEQAAREIFDTHDVKRMVGVTHLAGPKLYHVSASESDFWVTTETRPGGKELSVPLSSFINMLNSLQPDHDKHLDSQLAIEALTHLWEVRCTVRAN